MGCTVPSFTASSQSLGSSWTAVYVATYASAHVPCCCLPGGRDSIVQESRVTVAYLGSRLGIKTTGVGEFGPMLCTVSPNPRVGTLSSKVVV